MTTLVALYKAIIYLVNTTTACLITFCNLKKKLNITFFFIFFLLSQVPGVV